MSIYYRQMEQHIVITGKTFPYKDLIKSLGGRFSAGDKVWLVPNSEENLSGVHNFCKSVGGGALKVEGQNLREKKVVTSPSSAKGKGASKGPEPLPVKDGLTVSELLTKAQLALTGAFPQALWVIGEIQNYAERKVGCFFDFAEPKEGSQGTIAVKATLWQGALRILERKYGGKTLKEVLQDGLKVRLLCQVSLYRDRAQLSLNIMDIDPDYTRGALALARERLLQELRAKGLYERNKSLILPAFPFKVGLISAEGSRAKSDFLHQLLSYGFCGEVKFYAAQMQGERLPGEVVAGLEFLQGEGCDVIVITRGGGSAADLRWFDTKDVAYAVAKCPVPILAAIGHHDDTCVVEEIAYRREKTPTAAADFIISVFTATAERLDLQAKRLAQCLTARVERERQRHEQVRDRLYMQSQERLSQMHGRLGQRERQLQHVLHQTMWRLTELLGRLQHRLLNVMSGRFNGAYSQLSGLKARLENATSRQLLAARHRCEQWANRLWQGALQVSHQKERQFAVLERRLASLDPSPWLEKGWTRLYLAHKAVVSSEGLKDTDILEARIRDALLQLKVQHVIPKGGKE